jgi:hypothetical protein
VWKSLLEQFPASFNTSSVVSPEIIIFSQNLKSRGGVKCWTLLVLHQPSCDCSAHALGAIVVAWAMDGGNTSRAHCSLCVE